MSVVIVTGSTGLIGCTAVRHFGELGLDVVGVDNDMRRFFFGPEASTHDQLVRLESELGDRYRHVNADIRDDEAINQLFEHYANDVKLIIHAAGQPSHDWAADDPHTDFSVNAVGTLNLLEATRRHCPCAAFIFTSTNKVYGARPNDLPLVELSTRWEIDASHPYSDGVKEDMSIDNTLHSLFGASKASADLLVQEYGRYFGMATACFRCGCLTGPQHAGVQQHGFLAYLLRCCISQTPYTVFGYQGKQVRDNIHSADLISAFEHFFHTPRCAEVYNMGGGRFSNCSMLEAIDICERIADANLCWTYSESNRVGDHVWWISSLAKFQEHYPAWSPQYDVPEICQEIHDANVERWAVPSCQ